MSEQGLRDALKELADEWERQPSSYLKETAGLLRDLLRFHPAETQEKPASAEDVERRHHWFKLARELGQEDDFRALIDTERRDAVEEYKRREATT
jgi:hypothetical protein